MRVAAVGIFYEYDKGYRKAVGFGRVQVRAWGLMNGKVLAHPTPARDPSLEP